MVDFKDFLDAVERCERRRDLFLFSSKGQLQGGLLDLFNGANERGLHPVWNPSQSRMAFNDQQMAYLRISHENVAITCADLVWSGLHGLETLDKYDNAVEQRARFGATLRPDAFHDVS